MVFFFLKLLTVFFGLITEKVVVMAARVPCHFEMNVVISIRTDGNGFVSSFLHCIWHAHDAVRGTAFGTGLITFLDPIAISIYENTPSSLSPQQPQQPDESNAEQKEVQEEVQAEVQKKEQEEKQNVEQKEEQENEQQNDEQHDEQAG